MFESLIALPRPFREFALHNVHDKTSDALTACGFLDGVWDVMVSDDSMFDHAYEYFQYLSFSMQIVDTPHLS